MTLGETTIPEDEYTVSYSNNINPGTATVTITDKEGGNYTINSTVTFKILQRGDANGDGKVNVVDIVYVEAFLNYGTKLEGFNSMAANADGLGIVDEADVEAIKDIIMANP